MTGQDNSTEAGGQTLVAVAAAPYPLAPDRPGQTSHVMLYKGTSSAGDSGQLDSLSWIGAVSLTSCATDGVVSSLAVPAAFHTALCRAQPATSADDSRFRIGTRNSPVFACNSDTHQRLVARPLHAPQWEGPISSEVRCTRESCCCAHSYSSTINMTSDLLPHSAQS